MSINKETIKSIGEYISKYTIIIAPGIILIEIVFNKGFVSGGIQNLYDMILLLIWSAILSIPYYPLVLFLSARFECNSPSELSNFKIDDPSDYESIVPLVIVLSLVTSLLYLLIKNIFSWPNVLIGIEIKYLLFLVSIIITLFVALPMGAFYFWVIDCVLKNIHRSVANKKVT